MTAVPPLRPIFHPRLECGVRSSAPSPPVAGLFLCAQMGCETHNSVAAQPLPGLRIDQ